MVVSLLVLAGPLGRVCEAVAQDTPSPFPDGGMRLLRSACRRLGGSLVGGPWALGLVLGLPALVDLLAARGGAGERLGVLGAESVEEEGEVAVA